MCARAPASTRVWLAGVLSCVALAALALSRPVLAQVPDVPSRECPGCLAQPAPARFDGIWSSALTAGGEPGWALADYFCFAACSSEGRAEAERLLAGAETAQRPALELYPRAVAANSRSVEQLAAGLAPSDGQLPGFSCDPHGFAAQVVSPLPLEIRSDAGRVTLRYEEFAAERAIAFGGAPADPHGAALGVSTGRFEGDALVVETRGIPAGRLSKSLGGFAHSDALRTVERYSVSADGRWLDLVLTLDDPATLAKPLVVTKRWVRAPRARIARHACDVMSAGLGGVFAEYLDPAIIDSRRRARDSL
jgi:hypothetical protein